MKNKLIYLVYIIFVIITFLYFDNKINVKESIFDKKNYEINDSKNQFKININRNLKQIKIIINDDNGTSFEKSQFKIIDSNSNIVYKENIIFKEFNFSHTHTINVSNLKLKGKYTIVFDYLDHITNKQNIIVQLHYLNNNIIIFRSLYIFISITFLILIMLYNKKINNTEIEKIFITLAIPLYILYIIFIPALAGHDEVFHYRKICELEEGNIVSYVPYNFWWSGAFISKGRELDLSFTADYKYSDVMKTINKKIENEKEFISGGSVDIYAPVQYIPSVIGFKITKLFTNRSLILVYGGRIFNALVCIMLLYLAIKIIPTGKKILSLFALSPLMIESFTTLSGDGITNSLIFLFLAYILKLYNSKEISTKQIIITSIMAGCVSLLKIVYFFVIFIFLLLPKEKFKQISKRKSIMLVIIIPIILNFVWLFLASNISAGSAAYSVPSKKIAIFLMNPFIVIKYIVYSIFTDGLNYILDFFSHSMLMCDVITNSFVVPLSLIVTSYLLLYDSDNDEKIKFSKKQNIFILSLIFIIIISIFLSIFMFYTIINSYQVYGIQGRYLYPIIPLYIILLKQVIKTKKIKYCNSLFIGCCILVNFMSLMEIIINFL